jgi:hypothetical protein
MVRSILSGREWTGSRERSATPASEGLQTQQANDPARQHGELARLGQEGELHRLQGPMIGIRLSSAGERRKPPALGKFSARICVKAEDQICAGLLERFDFIGPDCDRCDLPVLISLAQSTDACNIESDLSCRQ